MSMILSVPEIQQVIGPHFRRLGRCVWPIWNRYLEIPEQDRLTYDLTAEANVLNRYMIANAKDEFAGVPGVSFFEENGFVLGIDGFPFGLSGQVAARFKKLDVAGRSRNNLSSARARAIRNNESDGLPGVPPEATWVDVGHVLNGFRTNIADVQVIRVVGTEFVTNIPREEDGAVVMPQPLEPAATAPRFFIIRRREQNSETDSDQ